MHIPELVAHRGYALRYPENTLLAIEAAVLAGAKYVEVDVQLSADGVPVLFHDRDLQRICGVPGAVHEYSLADLKALSAREYDRFGYRFVQARLATLAELIDLLKLYPDVTAFVELKRVAINRFGVAPVLAEVFPVVAALKSRIVLISYALDALAAARDAGWPTLGAVIDHWRERRSRAIRDLAPAYLFCDVDGLPRFGKIQAGDARVVAFEVADARTALSLARRGVHLIETFAIGELVRDLELELGAVDAGGV